VRHLSVALFLTIRQSPCSLVIDKQIATPPAKELVGLEVPTESVVPGATVLPVFPAPMVKIAVTAHVIVRFITNSS
jgi:hypothetical protein